MRKVIVGIILLMCALLCGGLSGEAVKRGRNEAVTAIMGAFDKEVLLLEDQLNEPNVSARVLVLTLNPISITE